VLDGQVMCASKSPRGAYRTGPVHTVPVHVQVRPVSSTMAQNVFAAHERCSRSPGMGSVGRATSWVVRSTEGPVDLGAGTGVGVVLAQPASARSAASPTATAVKNRCTAARVQRWRLSASGAVYRRERL